MPVSKKGETMDWIQVLTIAGSTIGACWLMHRENAKETKDFHGRMCTLEERYFQLMQKMLQDKK
jgi:hypothetical protein